ncbi:triose-phosphate isomerase [Candidatus Viadribacter manganicus]|uniref:Triosephosphate isomerase n=1 Tax=Candidatus Viadribacter manganicus TaxID=1759059 RepID=A0A1B1AD98_9PROT|nr:triose-phosphate isomerase [Candidatus Viadribacter manganicus]ANP44536.1 triose-phosphate isomerase [Candidatus Viadribacter manganicus]
MGARKPLIAGNWKMFGRAADLAEIGVLAETIGAAAGRIDILICPPAAYVQSSAWQNRSGPILIGAQDCSPNGADAARTGEVSAAMLADAGAKYVIVGHSERRQIHKETDDLVRQKAEAALSAGLIPIVCVGETQDERTAGKVADVVGRQVRSSVPSQSGAFVVAYEPVWAIGGNSTPTLAEIAEVHALIRETLAGQFGGQANDTRILYGGSVNPKNAGEIFTVAGVDGALVGRASLKAADFSAIILGHPAAV